MLFSHVVANCVLVGSTVFTIMLVCTVEHLCPSIGANLPRAIMLAWRTSALDTAMVAVLVLLLPLGGRFGSMAAASDWLRDFRSCVERSAG
jgi:uncharacterized membrane protein YqhA